MTTLEVISLLASISSLILAIIAIWLSIVFYKMSSQLSESTKEAAKGIGASVDRLEKLFDKLYADTFSMMKDTVTDMRKHIWPSETKSEDIIESEAEKKADEKVDELRKEVKEQLAGLLSQQKMTGDQLNAVRGEIAGLFENVIRQSRRAEREARKETVRENIMKAFSNLEAGRGFVTADEVVNALEKIFKFSVIVEELMKMRTDGIVSFDDPIGPSTKVQLKK